MELKGKVINFLGDSVTGGCKVKDPSMVYHQIIARKMECTANVYGEGGSCFARETTEEEAKKWPPSFCDRIADMDPNADVNVVFGCQNDYSHCTAPIGTPDDRTPDTFYGACHYIIKTILEKYPCKPLIFMTPVHYQAEMLENEHGRIFKDYIDIVREVCEMYAIPVCDLFANSGIVPMLESQRPLLIPDGDHPNDLGHEIIASRFIGFVSTL